MDELAPGRPPAARPAVRAARIRCRLPQPRQRALTRPRLQRLLAPDALAPVTLIAAPAGFGKTTLAVGAAHALPPPWRVAWLTLEEGDGAPMRLLHGLVGALGEADAALVQHTATLLDAPQNLPPADLVLQLCDDLAGGDAPLLLVLDNVQCAGTPAAARLIDCIVDHLPPRMRLLLLSRELPALPLAAWRARGWLREIGQAELGFTADEAAAFLRDTMELPLHEHVTVALNRHVEGWPAGVQMAALSIQHRSGGDAGRDAAALALEFGGRHTFVMEFMTQQVLAAQPPDVREFLRRIAVLGTLAPGVCDAVSGRDDSAELLVRLDRANMFLTRLDDEHRWYRLHSLLQESLLAMLAADEQRALHRRAALWYAAQAMHADAFRHARQGLDMATCARAMLPLYEEMLCRGEVLELEQMLAGLPDPAFAGHPSLALQRAWLLYLTSSADRAQRFIAMARLDDPAAHGEASLGMLAAFRAYLALNWGDPAETERWARQAIAALPATSTYFAVVVQLYLGQAQVLLGQRAQAVQTLRLAHGMGQQVGNHAKALDALMHLALLLLDQGRVQQARQLAGDAVQRFRDRNGRPLLIGGLAQSALGAVHLACGELAPAVPLLDTGARLTERAGMLYFVLLTRCLCARAHHLAGRRDEAWAMLAAARETAEGAGGLRRRRLVEDTIAALMLYEGNATAAARLLPEGTAATTPGTEPDPLLVVRLRIVQRRHDAALRLLAPLEAAARRDAFDGVLVQVLVLQAVCQQALGHRQATLAALTQAIGIAAVPRLRLPFIEEGAGLHALLSAVRAAEPAFVDSLLRPGDEAPAAEPGEPPPQPLEALNQRDVELLTLINRGLRNREIAQELSLTIGTTKQYLNHLFAKLGARNRVEAILLGRRMKLLP